MAIGETGLDYDRVFSPIADQLDNLRRNLALALETGQAGDPPLPLGRRPARRPGRPGRRAARGRASAGRPGRAAFGDRPPAVIHSFSGPPDYARDVIDLGLAVSFSRPRLPARARRRRPTAAAIVPADRLLIETDSPFLAPPGAPRSRNQPEWVRVTGAWARRAAGHDPGRAGARPGRRVRPDVPESRRTDDPATRRLPLADRLTIARSWRLIAAACASGPPSPSPSAAPSLVPPAASVRPSPRRRRARPTRRPRRRRQRSAVRPWPPTAPAAVRPLHRTSRIAGRPRPRIA